MSRQRKGYFRTGMERVRIRTLIIILLWGVIVRAQTPVLVLTAATDPVAAMIEVRALGSADLHIAVVVAPGCYVGWTNGTLAHARSGARILDRAPTPAVRAA